MSDLDALIDALTDGIVIPDAPMTMVPLDVGLYNEAPAFEAFGPVAGPQVGKQVVQPATVILRREGVFHVTLDLRDVADTAFGDSGSQLRQTLIFLRMVSPAQYVQLYVTDGWGSDADGNLQLVVSSAIFSAVSSTRGKLALVADRLLSGIGAHLALATPILRVQPFAHLSLVPAPRFRDGADSVQPMAKFFSRLYTRARDRGILTDDELAALEDGRPVFITGQTLVERANGEDVLVYDAPLIITE